MIDGDGEGESVKDTSSSSNGSSRVYGKYGKVR